jgi:hypothetical protein
LLSFSMPCFSAPYEDLLARFLIKSQFNISPTLISCTHLVL